MFYAKYVVPPREDLTFSIIGAALLLSVIGLWFSIIIPGIDRWHRRFFTSYFIIALLCCLSGIAETAFQYIIVPEAVFLFILITETLLLSLPMPMV